MQAVWIGDEKNNYLPIPNFVKFRQDTKQNRLRMDDEVGGSTLT